jgi:phosphopentomutase
VGCLDCFLGKIFECLQDNTLFVMTSDHGNFEDLSTTQHTQNPVPLLVLGKGAEFFYTIKSIDEVAKTILNALHAFENEE